MINFLITGTVFGLSAGFAPGPLLTLVISETLQHNIKAGVKVALAPIITDLPIITLTLFILAKLSQFYTILGIISFLGGCLVLYFGFESIRIKGVKINLQDRKPKSLKKGIIVNATNPYPYLFWFSVGAPTIIKASHQSVFAATAFIGSFYVLLVGALILLAFLANRSRSLLKGRAYIIIMRFLGTALIVFAVFLFRDGLKLVGLL